MRTFLCWLALVVTAYVVQTSFLPLIFYRGIGPDLLLLITISFAFLKGRRLGCFMGFLLGLFEDLASGGFLGMNTFANMLMGFCCGIFSNRVLRDSFILPLAAAWMSTISVFCLFEIIFLLLGYGFFPLAHIKYKLLPMLCYNIVFAWPVHVMVHKVDKRVSEKK
ncbi:rod shape-determining protein MreD [Anaerovibrio sp.]|uniref:rod shape-determining protein MreD n=1 Tax=Anaerovibrio sp. TaxID=1872532 RepID=UPI00261A3F38|nr:rod shape-determining protein MreD [Anaerovibrio sp.]MDD6597810.1 rod shape-determining protein MreD [Anaerovibrio sp.]MDD7677724.1 rod shape-determining protein MreD [Anaerovibrio sp.]MDY2603636.1 rod shape-determining protein MreD [Anaerovibrio sp.]